MLGFIVKEPLLLGKVEGNLGLDELVKLSGLRVDKSLAGTYLCNHLCVLFEHLTFEFCKVQHQTDNNAPLLLIPLWPN